MHIWKLPVKDATPLFTVAKTTHVKSHKWPRLEQELHTFCFYSSPKGMSLLISERGQDEGGRGERNIDMRETSARFHTHPWLGIEPTTWAYTLTRNWTQDLFVVRADTPTNRATAVRAGMGTLNQSFQQNWNRGIHLCSSKCRTEKDCHLGANNIFSQSVFISWIHWKVSKIRVQVTLWEETWTWIWLGII